MQVPCYSAPVSQAPDSTAVIIWSGWVLTWRYHINELGQSGFPTELTNHSFNSNHLLTYFLDGTLICYKYEKVWWWRLTCDQGMHSFLLKVHTGAMSHHKENSLRYEPINIFQDIYSNYFVLYNFLHFEYLYNKQSLSLFVPFKGYRL